MEPNRIEQPTLPADAELWRIEIKVPGDVPWVVDNTTRQVAEDFLVRWSIDPEGLEFFCADCPLGWVVCPHDDALQLRHDQIYGARIMPMREAL